MSSKFTFKLWLIVPFLFAAYPLTIKMGLAAFDGNLEWRSQLVFWLMFSFCLVLLFWFRLNLNMLLITGHSVTQRNLLFWGKKTTLDFDDVKELQETWERNRYFSYDVLYVVAADNRIIKLSEFNYRNYHELKEILNQNIAHLRAYPGSVLEEGKVFFKNKVSTQAD